MFKVMDFIRIFHLLNGLLSGYFCYHLCGCFITWRRAVWIRIAAFLGITSLMILPIYFTDVVNVSGQFLGMLVLVLVGSVGTIAAKLSVVVIFYPIMLGISLVKYDFTSINFINYIEADALDYGINIVAILLGTMVWAGIFYFLQRRLNEVKRYMTAKIYLTTDILCMAAFVAILTATIFPSGYDKNADMKSYYSYQPKVGYLIVAASIISILAALVLMQRMTESVKKQMQLQAEQIKTEYYQTLLEQQEQTRHLVHDINNHFQMVEGYLRAGETNEAADYLAKVKESLPVGKGRKFCPDSAVNALLNSRYTKLLGLQADVHFNIDIGNMMGMEPMDLCTLFGNILDNAIEATEQVEEGKRAVKLQARCEKGFFTLREINSKANQVMEEEGQILTGKEEKGIHGYGIENVNEIAQKYGGKMEISYTEDEFSVMVYIQI